MPSDDEAKARALGQIAINTQPYPDVLSDEAAQVIAAALAEARREERERCAEAAGIDMPPQGETREYWTGWYEAQAHAIDRIRKLPPVLRESRAAGEWVRCSERMPEGEARELLLCTSEPRRVHKQYWAPGMNMSWPQEVWTHWAELPPLPQPGGTDG